MIDNNWVLGLYWFTVLRENASRFATELSFLELRHWRPVLGHSLRRVYTQRHTLAAGITSSYQAHLAFFSWVLASVRMYSDVHRII
jgi:hypothetical protein